MEVKKAFLFMKPVSIFGFQFFVQSKTFKEEKIFSLQEKIRKCVNPKMHPKTTILLKRISG